MVKNRNVYILACLSIIKMEISIFVRTLGGCSTARVLEYLITSRELPVHQSDVIRNSKVSKVTVIKVWKEMIKNGLIEYDRTIGKAMLYKLNIEDLKVKKLIDLYNVCLKQEAEAGLKEVEIKVPV